MWADTVSFAELVTPSQPHSQRALLAIAAACLRRVWDQLPPLFQEAVEACERGPEFVTPQLAIALLTELRPTVSANENRAITQSTQILVSAATAVPPADFIRALRYLADRCAEELARETLPERTLNSFPLPPDLEPFRDRVARAIENSEKPRSRGLRLKTRGERAAFEHLTKCAEDYNRERMEAELAERTMQCDIARDVLGFPEVVVQLSPNWRTSTVIAMAKEMLATQDFSGMPILADALQDSGCDVPEILEHCRSEKPHFRGCWVLDQILEVPRS